ncbi:MAG: hypothetical protein F6J93_26375 [Oscillatoria sp. SIO1A7]|nr:hypothetical protein [Oscillatoria sp. SIO1A7]
MRCFAPDTLHQFENRLRTAIYSFRSDNLHKSWVWQPPHTPHLTPHTLQPKPPTARGQPRGTATTNTGIV